MTFVYSDSTAVVGPLATAPEPHSWDLCVAHAGRITAPRGWELVRHAGPLPASPDEDDLVALADAVRESRDGRERVVMGGRGCAALDGFVDPANGAPLGCNGTHGANGANSSNGVNGTALARLSTQSATVGRRRGHLRVLPDPPQ